MLIHDGLPKSLYYPISGYATYCYIKNYFSTNVCCRPKICLTRYALDTKVQMTMTHEALPPRRPYLAGNTDKKNRINKSVTGCDKCDEGNK